MTGYSIFKSNGSWFVRWSEYRDGKRTQPSHKLCSVKHYPKESEIKPQAEAYMITVRKTMTVEAGASVKEFVNGVFLPKSRDRAKLLSDGWEQIKLRRAEYEIRRKIKGTNLAWRGWYAGWYAFRRGLATNLYRCGMRPEQACLILRNSAEVVRRHYIRLEQEGTKIGAMARLEQAYEQCAASVQ